MNINHRNYSKPNNNLKNNPKTMNNIQNDNNNFNTNNIVINSNNSSGKNNNNNNNNNNDLNNLKSVKASSSIPNITKNVLLNKTHKLCYFDSRSMWPLIKRVQVSRQEQEMYQTTLFT